MNCFECAALPLPAGMTFADRSAVGICLRCGRGLCRDHGSYDAAARAFLCGSCAATPARAAKH